jgi:hypothetical protein
VLSSPHYLAVGVLCWPHHGDMWLCGTAEWRFTTTVPSPVCLCVPAVLPCTSKVLGPDATPSKSRIATFRLMEMQRLREATMGRGTPSRLKSPSAGHNASTSWCLSPLHPCVPAVLPCTSMALRGPGAAQQTATPPAQQAAQDSREEEGGKGRRTQTTRVTVGLHIQCHGGPVRCSADHSWRPCQPDGHGLAWLHCRGSAMNHHGHRHP